MSHFSKIKTNISSLEMLKKTLKDLGFSYIANNSLNNDIIVFKKNDNSQPLFNFAWDGKEFILMADLYLWNLDVSVEYFLEKLSQQYAYNIVLNESLVNGFDYKIKTLTNNGSIKLIVEKWNHE